MVSLAWLLSTLGCRPPQRPSDVTSGERNTENRLSAQTINKIERFCGDCHPLPLPDTFPKANWPQEVRQGFQFYVESGRTDLVEPIRQDTIQYFQQVAPEKIIVARADSMEPQATSIRFEAGSTISTPHQSPAIAHVVWNVQDRSLLFTDMQHGTLHKWARGSADQHLDGIKFAELLATGRNFCRVHVCDWNMDGIDDYLIGEMGSFPVGDHDQGRVSLLLGHPDGTIEAITLADKLGRAVSAVPFDYDRDGGMDVLVAEFGWRKTGALKLLRNTEATAWPPRMQTETIDPRHGALGVEVGDMDGDGQLDFVVAYGQEFETVEAYLYRDTGRYERQVLLSLPDPSYNSSSFQLVDLDRDGRLDVVLTCGDTLDAFIAKPYHGVRWLHNLGEGKWDKHDLGLLVGALQTAVADFDNDGDLDIAGVGLFPTANVDGPGMYDSICVWEQREHLQFVRHSIERDNCNHATCAAADVDGDGRVDLIVGQWLDNQSSDSVRVLLNATPQAGRELAE